MMGNIKIWVPRVSEANVDFHFDLQLSGGKK
jgi:hypothetical protein